MNLKLGVETNLKFEDRPKRSILPQYDEPDLDKSKKNSTFLILYSPKIFKNVQKMFSALDNLHRGRHEKFTFV